MINARPLAPSQRILRSAFVILFPALFMAGACASQARAADDAGVPQALGGTVPAIMSAPTAGGYDPAQVCAQACTCSCPNGIFIPATPVAPSGSEKSAAGTGSANASGSAHAGFHASGMFGPHHGSEFLDDNLDYPTSMVERPVRMPNGITQPELAATFFNDSLNSASSVRERISLAAQTSLANRWQAGGVVSVSINPRILFDSLLATGQYALKQPAANDPTALQANARLDAGVRHSVCGDGSSAFSGGLGFPSKLRLNPHLALVSARTTLAAYSYEEDVLTWDVKSCGTNYTLNLPIGLLATFDENINFAIRSGYRYLSGNGASTSFIPVDFDFAVVVGGQTDIGLTLELPNSLGTPTNYDSSQSIWFEQRLYVFAQTRL